MILGLWFHLVQTSVVCRSMRQNWFCAGVGVYDSRDMSSLSPNKVSLPMFCVLCRVELRCTDSKLSDFCTEPGGRWN